MIETFEIVTIDERKNGAINQTHVDTRRIPIRVNQTTPRILRNLEGRNLPVVLEVLTDPAIQEIREDKAIPEDQMTWDPITEMDAADVDDIKITTMIQTNGIKGLR